LKSYTAPTLFGKGNSSNSIQKSLLLLEFSTAQLCTMIISLCKHHLYSHRLTTTALGVMFHLHMETGLLKFVPIYGNSIYVINILFKTLISTATRTWKCIIDKFVPYTESPAVIYKDVMYIFAGFGTSRTNLLLTYDTITKKLATDSNVTGIGRSAHTAVLYGDHAYIFGGYSGLGGLNQLVKFDFGKKIVFTYW
jgi:hypothetical protein